MPPTRRSSQRTTPQRAVPPKPLKAQTKPVGRLLRQSLSKDSIKQTSKRRSTPAGLINDEASSLLKDTLSPTLSRTSLSQSPAPESSVRHQKRIYISDSDDDDVEKLVLEQKSNDKPVAKQRKIVESDEEEEPEILEIRQASKTPSDATSEISIQTIESTNAQKSGSKQQLKKVSSAPRRVSARQERLKALEQIKKEDDLKKLVAEKMKKAPKLEQKPQQRKMAAMVATKKKKGTDEDVEAEFSVVLLRPSASSSSSSSTTKTTLNRIQFQQPVLQKMNECKGKLKNRVKHLELTYKTKRNNEGIAFNKVAAFYDGIYKAESSTKGERMLKHAIGFFKEGQFFMVPVEDTYEMRRQIQRPIDLDILEQNRADDANYASANASASQGPVLNPIRVRFARTETDMQRKRREQSFQYRQMLYDQDEWVDMNVKKESISNFYKTQISKSKQNGAASMLKRQPKLPLI